MKTTTPSRRTRLAKWSIAVRFRDDNQCAVCGAARYIQGHHILPKERYPEFQFEVDNGISLCPSHHKFGKLSFHRNAIWSSIWLRLRRPELWMLAVKRMGIEGWVH